MIIRLDFISEKVLQFFNYLEKTETLFKKKSVVKILKVPYNISLEFVVLFEDSTMMHFTIENNEVDYNFIEKLKTFEKNNNFNDLDENETFLEKYIEYRVCFTNNYPEFKFCSIKSIENLKKNRLLIKNPLKYYKFQCSCISDSGKKFILNIYF